MKKIIGVLFLVLLIGFIVLVPAVRMEMNFPGTTTTSDFTERNYQFYAGWNLVQGILNPEWIQTNNKNIKAIYALNPMTKEYVRFYPEPENDKIGETNYNWGGFASIGALWVYSDKDFSSKYWALESFPLDSTPLIAGWNFIGISDEMTININLASPEESQYTLNAMKGDCDWTEVYTYGKDGGEMKWMDLLNNPNFMNNEPLSNELSGTGLVIKVSSDCTLGRSGSIIAPPTIPN